MFKEVAMRAAKEAGDIQVRYFRKVTKVIEKSFAEGLVSKVDYMCEKKIISLIHGKFSDHNIVAEESDTIDNKSAYTWYVDPLDGTVNYLYGIKEFGVTIAVAKDDVIILGVIYFPLTNEWYVAERGKGAFYNGKKIKVSNTSSLKKSLVFYDSGLHRQKKKKMQILSKIVHAAYRLRMPGAAIYSLSEIASGVGQAALFLQIHSWDVAAGALLIEEAGGKVTDFKGRPWKVTDDDFVASNGKVHGALLNVLK